MREKKNPTLGRVSLLLTTIIWGTSFVVQKNTLDSISTLHLLALRFTIATVLLFLIAVKDWKKLDFSYLKGGVFMGLALAAAYIIQTYGLVYTTPGKNAFLTASYCVMTPFLYWAFKKRRPGKHNIIAAFLCLIGVGLISVDGNFNINIGDVLTIICGFFYALHIIIIDEQAEGKSAALLTAVQFSIAALVTWILAVIIEPTPRHVPSSAVFSLFYLGIMCTGICFLLQTYGQKNTPASQAAILLTLESVFGTVISVIFYDEPMSVKLILGFVAMFAAVLISETRLSFLKKKREP